MKNLFRCVLIGAVIWFGLPISTSQAATATIHGMSWIFTSDNCQTIDSIRVNVTFEGTTEDEPLTDGDFITFVVYDGTGAPFLFDTFHTLVSGHAFTESLNIDRQVSGGQVSSGPFTVIIYDVTTATPSVEEAAINPIISQITVNPTTVIGGMTCTFGSDSPVSDQPAVIPGCDVRMWKPANAVVFQFTAPADLYWSPDNLITPLITLPAGKTAWVLSLDSTGQFYQIIWGCQYLWVEANNVGPNPDDVWHNAPLPSFVVE